MDQLIIGVGAILITIAPFIAFASGNNLKPAVPLYILTMGMTVFGAHLIGFGGAGLLGMGVGVKQAFIFTVVLGLLLFGIVTNLGAYVLGIVVRK